MHTSKTQSFKTPCGSSNSPVICSLLHSLKPWDVLLQPFPWVILETLQIQRKWHLFQEAFLNASDQPLSSVLSQHLVAYPILAFTDTILTSNCQFICPCPPLFWQPEDSNPHRVTIMSLATCTVPGTQEMLKNYLLTLTSNYTTKLQK